KFKVHNYDTSSSSNLTSYQEVEGLNVDIYGILIGTDKFEILNYVCAGKDNKEFGKSTSYVGFTYGGLTIKDLGVAFNKIVSDITAENYIVVVPLDNNFHYLYNSAATVSYMSDSSNYEFSELQSYDSGITSQYQSDKISENKDGGLVKYDSVRNAIIWNLAEYKGSDGDNTQLSTSGRIYQLTFYLKYTGTGTIVDKYNSSGYRYSPYAAVNDNGSRSVNRSRETSFPATLTATPTKGNSGTYNEYLPSGVYTFIASSNSEYLNQTNSQEANGFNYTEPVYLPLYELNINKVRESQQSISGAEFEVYRVTDKTASSSSKRYEKLSFNGSSGVYSYNDNGSVTALQSTNDGKYTVSFVPPGDYYLYESKYPTAHIKGNTSTVNITTTSNNTIPAYKISVSAPSNNFENQGNYTIAKTIYNKPVANLIVHVNSSDNIKRNFEFTLTYTYINSAGNVIGPFRFTTTGISDGNGNYTFTELPLYNYYRNGTEELYGKRTYYLSETGYDSGNIPSRYFTVEYGSSFANTSSAASYTVGELSTTVTKEVYVYNPSIRVTVNNFDADNHSIPLSSRFTLNSETLTTSSNGTVTSGEWFGYGTNTLTQTKVPSGYNLLRDSESFTLNSSTAVEVKYAPGTGNRYYQYELTVYNSKKTDIPNTGGSGNFWLMIFSVILLCMSGISFLIYFKYFKSKDLM
ncbi:MAG: LPXTG cell wall anchor domain-containing protein, partial [Ruminococcus sp.]|nr:LPXTG cell wall anchor domain-containing protein [Ruminococcus sp.]